MGVVVLVLVLAGCGGGSGEHTYILVASRTSRARIFAAGIYVTVVSPLAFPPSTLTEMKKKYDFVDHAVGPEVCSFSIKAQGEKGAMAFMNGKIVKVNVRGTNPLASTVCAEIRHEMQIHGITL
ncbi:MAG TPA: hypothetical protein VE985_09985 [Gaiellaceae bacterium]|nr:hypothetical protein [Gaiellaceae bacterium]